MFKCVSRLIVLLAAVQILGGHWVALQSVAWVGMLASHSRAEKLTVAIEKTFDGQSPCGLCKVVKAGREQEQKQQTEKTVVKLEAMLSPAHTLGRPPFSDWEYAEQLLRMKVRALAPAIPPPLAV